tara:strand:+ start:9108 stop:10103 length:996 start_codon:yes stop_codon:yes gene_type:complete
MKNLKILVIGYGSIGKRHVKNLLKINNNQISICTHNNDALKLKNKNVKIFKTVSDAVKEEFDLVVICNETSLHVKTALKFAEKGCHIFFEKPISDSLEEIPKLKKLIKQKKIISMVGCNMRFLPGIKLMKKLIEKESIGRIFSVLVENGSYMPDWHPWEDYKRSYAGRKKLGGGVVLTQIHEYDYLFWFFGKVDEVYAINGKFSDLKIDVEDLSASLLKFKKKIIAEVHLDYFQKPSQRSCKIIGTKGQIKWQWENDRVEIFNYKTKKLTTKNLKKKFDRNQMYVNEMKYFLKCIKTKKIPMNSITEALKIQEVALAIKKSSEKKIMISLD